MEKISEEELHKLLKTEVRIREKEINLSNIDLENINLARFENCNFTSPRTLFNKSTFYENETIIKKTNIYFNSCSFNDLLIHEISDLENLFFSQIKSAKSILIHHSNIELFVFNKNDNINYNIELVSCVFEKHFNFTENTFIKYGKFQLLKNTFHEVAFISKNTFTYLVMWEQKFLSQLHFENKYNKGLNSDISSSEFKKTIISVSEFSNFTFKNCLFFEEFYFENCENLAHSEVRFEDCCFDKISNFDNSKLNKMEILRSKFHEKASFENLETNYFKIHQVTFAEAAYFDDLNKDNNDVIENWDRKTLRAIKRELINTHNQIDYLRFKAYELNAYKKEVNLNKLNWKDSLILYFNEDSNYFGLDWTKGIRFIFQWSFILYLFYIISYSACINNLSYIPKTEDFLVNYLKFTNPLSFLKTPLENSENYFFPLLFLSVSKIFVSYGIYQTIQAFRKFGVNGG